MQPDLKIIDSEIRLKDYIRAITLWVEHTSKTNTQIWILENTNSLDILKSECSKRDIDNSRIKYFSTPLDTKSQTNGKSAGEFEMLKSVSRKIMEGDFESVTKVTGRLYVSNFRSCLYFSSKVDFACGRFYSPSHIVDSRFFSLTPEVFELIFNKEIEFSTGMEKSALMNLETFLSMEHYLTYRAFQLESMGYRVSSFPSVPLYIGQSASTGKKLNLFKVNLKIRIANSFRKIAIKFISGYTP